MAREELLDATERFNPFKGFPIVIGIRVLEAGEQDTLVNQVAGSEEPSLLIQEAKVSGRMPWGMEAGERTSSKINQFLILQETRRVTGRDCVVLQSKAWRRSLGERAFGEIILNLPPLGKVSL